MTISRRDNVKQVARSDEPTENCKLNLPLPSGSRNCKASFSSLFS